MRLVTFVEAGAERLGFLVGDTVVDPLRAFGERSGDARALFADAAAFIRSGDKGIAAARAMLADPPKQALLPRSGVTLTAPLRPSTILCSGSNYHDHNAEKANAPISGKEPEFFVKTADCVVGPDEPVVQDPALTRKLDCETELAIVIGKPGRHIPIERALDHVFGYTIVNDVTARDRQVRKSAEGTIWYDLGRGKAFDGSAPLGPCITTADEIPDPQRLALETRINGELRQSSHTSKMIWSCAELIYFFSINFTLRPGMVIITGTPAGTAWSSDRELGGKGITQPGLVAATRYCLPGDLIECEIESIGTLRNRVVGAEAEAEYGADRKLHRTAIA
jgi:2-keto-4-pentenoate hydratase/2-oxohepta-3-ene-1,7-dioic acid hydratase in catechol pathway